MVFNLSNSWDKAFEIYIPNQTYTKEFKQSVINERILSDFNFCYS
ncbi:hypothetical protein CBC_A1868 [Clostridium botulinum C str. Eklund]|nr:hypothetical protein CBC_A1868 [Clostridium botulinum C str. Eklund]